MKRFILDKSQGYVRTFMWVGFLLLALTPSLFSQQPYDIVTSLTPDIPTSNDFGFSVAIDNDLIIVGAPNPDYYENSSPGEAYIFKLNGNSWEQQALLTAGDGIYEFGFQVAISGNRAVVGAIDANAVYIYYFDGMQWIEEAILAENATSLGYSVAIQEDLVFAGAANCAGFPPYSGVVYCYQRTDSAWERYQILIADDATAYMFFSRGLEIDGDQAIIGAPGYGNEGDINLGTGTAYIYQFNGIEWELQAQIMASDLDTGDEFGRSVALEDNIAVIGAYEDDDQGSDAGSAYIFRYDGENWEQELKLSPDLLDDDDNFGYSVAIYRNRLVIGAPNYNDWLGGIFLYEYGLDQNEWISKGIIENPENFYDFGQSVVMTSNHILSGGHFMERPFVYELIAQPYPVTISNGVHNNRINISWENRSPSVENFKIYRDGEELLVVDGSAGSYNDFNTVPGKIYTYGVSAINDMWGESPVRLSSGWSRTNGRIDGSVNTIMGAGVDSVQLSVSPADAAIATALQFDGNSDYILVPGNETFNAENWTIETWVHPQGSGDVLYRPLNNDSSFFITYHAYNACISLGYRDFIGSNFAVTSVPGSVPLEQWTHLTGVSDSTSLKIYINGEFNNAMNRPDFAFQGISSIYIGRGVHGYYSGLIDEVRFWNEALELSKIKQNMYSVLEGTEEGLLAYWAFDDPGRSGASIAADYARGRGHHGQIYGAAWMADTTILKYQTLTDVNGDYMLRNIYYDEVREFLVSPFKEDHGFDPVYRNRTLETTVPIASNVMFTDTTTFTVIGYIQYAGTNCNVKGVEVLLDDFPSGILTDGNGMFSLAIEHPGVHTITPQWEDSSSAHHFNPADTIMNIQDDILDLPFIDTETHIVRGKVRAVCNAVLGTAQIEFCSIEHNEGLWADTIVTDSEGNYTATLPAQKYRVDVVDLDPFDPIILQYFESDTVDLTWQDREKDFIYRTPPVIRIVGLEEFGCGDYAVPIVHQHDLYHLTIEVLDAYGEDTCFVAEGSVTINDDISANAPEPVTIELDSGRASYSFIAGEPNILAGGAHPFQKLFQVTAEVGQENSSLEQWILITGYWPMEATFTTTSPEQVLWVLHDPPGDQSASFLMQDSTLSCFYSHSFKKSSGHGMYTEISSGVILNVGSVIATENGSYAIACGDGYGSTGSGDADGKIITFTTTEEFSTSGNDQIVGEAGDVFVGTSFNEKFQLTKVIDFDRETCTVVQDTAIAWDIEDVATTFLYTESHIKNTLLPQLRMLLNLAEEENNTNKITEYTNSIHIWQNELAVNDSIVAAAPVERNISFSAGVDATYTQTSSTQTDTTWSNNHQEELYWQVGVGVVVTGCAGEIGYQGYHERYTTDDTTETTQTTTTTGYTLSDDDPGDFFSVNVKKDPRGTPAFELFAGTSSCPWENGTQPRDGVQMMVNTYEQNDVPPDEQAPFILSLGNTSQTGEEREYWLSPIQSGNLDGAIIRVGGVVIEDHLSYTIPGGEQLTATMSVERGPVAYDYENMKLRFYSPCDAENIADTLTFSVHYISPCSHVHLFLPENNWVLNQEDHDTLQITLTDYDIYNQHLEEIRLQYRRIGEGWSTAFIFPRNELPEDYINRYWDVSDLPDGNYEIRAASDCGAYGVTYSPVAAGVIDRQALMVFGTPQPSDGILNIGEDITIAFSGEIDESTVTAGGNVTVLNHQDSNFIEIETSLFENALSILTVEDISMYENQTLTAAVSGIRDIYGNQLRGRVEWSFRVSQNPVYWTVSNVHQTVYQGSDASFSRILKNAGGEEQSFTITQFPAWLSPNPVNGDIPAEGEQQINFAIDDQLNPGSYDDTVVVSSAAGDEPLIVHLTVLAEPPVWNINAAAYSYSMNITAQVAFEDSPADDAFDIISACSGNNIRGVANIQYVPAVDKYLAFLTVYSNQSSGEALTFRMWDASRGREFACMNSDFEFENNAALGNAANPVLIESDASIQSIDLNQGWSWISLNVESDDLSVQNVMSDLAPANGDFIKSQTAFSQYYNGVGWMGSLRELETGKSYQVNAAQNTTIRNAGNPVDVSATVIPVTPGWNWIGYFHQEILDVNEALETLPASAGDRIKSQTEFAEYVAATGTWEGSLDKLTPGQGYLLKSNTECDLEYPGLNKAGAGNTWLSFAAKPDWQVKVQDFEFNMSFTSVFEFDNLEMQDTSVIISAFVDGECRGISKLQYVPELDNYMAFLLVYGNTAEGDSVTFKIYQPAEDLTREVEESVLFSSDDIHGDLESPFVFTALPIGDELVPYTFYMHQNYPNPFNPKTTIEYGLPAAEKVSLVVYNILGQRVQTLVNERQEADRYTITFDATNPMLPNGVYFYRLKAGKYVRTRKMLIMK